MRLSSLFADTVYDQLVIRGGAPEWERDNFIGSHNQQPDVNTPDEWRFQGKLGFGGKYWSHTNTVTCYPEDLTPERAGIIEAINKRLELIKNLCSNQNLR